MVKEAIAFITRSEKEPMLREEKENASISFIYHDIKSPQAVEPVVKLYPICYVTPQF